MEFASGLAKVSEFGAERLTSFAAMGGKYVHFGRKTQRAHGPRMGGFNGEGLILRGMLIRPKVSDFST